MQIKKIFTTLTKYKAFHPNKKQRRAYLNMFWAPEGDMFVKRSLPFHILSGEMKKIPTALKS